MIRFIILILFFINILLSCNSSNNIVLYYLSDNIYTPVAIKCDDIEEMAFLKKLVITSRTDIDFILTNVNLLAKYQNQYNNRSYDIRHKIYINGVGYCFNNYMLYDKDKEDVQFSEEFKELMESNMSNTKTLNPLFIPPVVEDNN